MNLESAPIPLPKIKFIDRHTRTIYNANDKKLLIIPCDSSLNDIVPDLWGVIIGYINHHPFIIGKKKLGYRKITLNEFDDRKYDFLKYYHDNDGICVHGDTVKNDNMIQIERSYVFLNNSVLHFSIQSNSDKMRITNSSLNNNRVNELNYYRMTSHLDVHNTILVPDV
jgi:hypothetical protein